MVIATDSEEGVATGPEEGVEVTTPLISLEVVSLETIILLFSLAPGAGSIVVDGVGNANDMPSVKAELVEAEEAELGHHGDQVNLGSAVCQLIHSIEERPDCVFMVGRATGQKVVGGAEQQEVVDGQQGVTGAACLQTHQQHL